MEFNRLDIKYYSCNDGSHLFSSHDRVDFFASNDSNDPKTNCMVENS